LEHEGRPRLTRLGFDAWIKVHDEEVAALDFQSAIMDAPGDSCGE